MKFKPLADYVLIEPLDRIESAIIYVVGQRRAFRGEVKAVGPGRYDETKPDGNLRKLKFRKSLDVKVGDIVNFGETPVQFPKYVEDGKTYWIIQEADIGFIEVDHDSDCILSVGSVPLV